MKKSKIFLAVATLLNSSSVVLAENLKTADIEVTATLVERDLSDVPMSVGVVSEKDIKTSGAQTIGDLLKDIPGVNLNNDGSQGLIRVGIRGENAFRTLVLIDGQKISEHKSMSGAPLLIDPSTVERIEVIKGPASVQYGADALGGVINIITKKNSDKPLGLDLSLSYDSKATAGFSTNASVYGSNNGFNFRLSGSFANGGDLKTAQGHVPNTGYQNRSGSAFFSYDLNADTTIGLIADVYNADIHSGLDNLGSYKDFAVDIPTWDRRKVGIFAEFLNLNDYLSRLRLDAFYQYNNKVMYNLVDMSPTMKMQSNADNHIETLGLSAQADWQLGDYNYLISGLGASFDNLYAKNLVEVNVKQGFMQVQQQSQSNLNGYQNTYYAFLSNETILPSDFTVNYGVRYTLVESALQNYQESATTITNFGNKTTSSSSPYAHHTDSRPVFNIGTVWKGIEDLSLRLNYSQGFRSPILQERYTNSSMGGITTLANSNLDPETSHNFELGARYNKAGFDLDTALYFSKIKDYISTQYLNSYTAQYKNIAKAQSFGAEVIGSYTFDNGFKPYASMNFLRRKFETPTSSTYYTDTPAFTYRLGLAYEHDYGNYSLNSDLYLRGATERKALASDDNLLSYSGFTTANAQMLLSFGKDRAYSVNFQVLNILNKEYRVTNALSEPGRHFVITANASF